MHVHFYQTRSVGVNDRRTKGEGKPAKKKKEGKVEEWNVAGRKNDQENTKVFTKRDITRRVLP